jgi:hypothetical protein
MSFICTEVESDSPFKADCRRKQSHYRETVLKENYEIDSITDINVRYGNYLIHDETTGSNFISTAAFNYAKQRVRDKVICPELTIDVYRLFNNMLSSMPLCFNLFSDLRELLLQNADECAAVVKALFKEIPWINTVEYIGVEFIPTPISDYTGDKSAFDAVIIVKDAAGKRGLITIETKYTDILGDNRSAKNELKDKLIVEDKLFDDKITAELLENGYPQIYRNFLLTYAYYKRNRMAHFANVIISPTEDTDSVDECRVLSKGLRKLKGVLFKVDLEEFVERGIASGSDKVSSIYSKIHDRYIQQL